MPPDHQATLTRWLLTLLCVVRQLTLLGFVTATMVLMVAFKCSDGLSICFNTVAVLFVLDLDNRVFSRCLPIGMRERLEKLSPTTSTRAN